MTDTQNPPTQRAEIVGKVEYREGDGAPLAIRRGPIEVRTTLTDATLSWVDGATHGSTAIPLADYKRFVKDGAIRVSA